LKNRSAVFSSFVHRMQTHSRDFLVRVARQHGARYVSVAHNRDDSVESVLHALLRGTGPAGLCGIPMFRDLSGSDQSTQDSDLILARPLLNIGGEQLRQWLTDQEYHHREDSSNQDTHYTRNWIRHRLLPTIIERFPSAIESVDRAISLQRDWAEVVGEQRDAFAAAHVLRVDYDGESQFVIQCTRAYPAAVIIDAMRMAFQDASWSRSRMDQAHWRRLASWIRDEQVEKDSLVRSAASNDVEKPSHPKRPSQSEKSIDLGTLPGKIRVIRRGTSIHLQRDV
ncbi:MAG: tRNA lysidine(34) synthetase, partial [Planctomycetota bacterium]